MNEYFTISQRDFQRAIEIANEEGRMGYHVQIGYMPPQSATQVDGGFAVARFEENAMGELKPV